MTTSVCTVRPHDVLLESGYTNTETTGAGGGTTVSYPQAYLRFGASDPHLEFDVPQSYFAFVPSFVASASLPGPSEFYVEHTYFSRAGAGLGAKSLIDTAFLRDFGNSVRLDVEYGFSPTLLDGQRQQDLGAGASFMF
jgi:hypothetical protein